MACFDEGPVELIIRVLQESDFVGIKSLREVYPRVDDIVKENAARIFRGLRDSHPVLVTDECRDLFRRIALVNRQSVLCRNIDEYISLLGTEPPTEILLKNNPELSIHMFDLGAQIQKLACACLTILKNNLESSLSLEFGSGNWHDVTYSFSWVEEYRVYRALWYMCYHSDLHDALNRWDWPSESISSLSESAVMLHIEDFLTDEVWQVERALEKLGLRKIPGPCWFRTRNSALPLFRTIMSVSCAEYSVWPCPALPAESDENDDWGRAFHASQRESQNLIYIWLLCKATAMIDPAVQYTDAMLHFLEVGLFIWDGWRRDKWMGLGS